MKQWKEPSPAQSQFPIVLADGKQEIAVGKTIEFRKAADDRAPNIRVKIEKLTDGQFSGVMPQGHYAAGRIPNTGSPGMITISLCT